MNQQTLNPYVDIGAQVSPALNAIIAYLHPIPLPQVSDLVAAITQYMTTNYFPGATPQQVTELNSIAYNAINSYNTNLVLSGNAMYNAIQSVFIELLIGAGMTANTAPASFNDVVADIEDNIGTSQLTVNEQTPLFLATTVGAAASAYWTSIIGSPGFWAPYLPTNPGQLYMNTLLWNVAAMNGALAGYGSSIDGLVEPTTARVGNRMLSALIGALAATAGKVLFNWSLRITKPFDMEIAGKIRHTPGTGGGGPVSVDMEVAGKIKHATGSGGGGPVSVIAGNGFTGMVLQ